MNEVQLEAALTISDPESEARKKVEDEIRRIVHDMFIDMLWKNSGTVCAIADNSFHPYNGSFRDSVLSVMEDQLRNPRMFNHRV